LGPGKPIAIVGASCRFPGAPDLARYWNLLRTGRDAIGEVPEGRWTKSFFFHPHAPTPGKSYSWAAGTIGTVDGFDAEFFGMSPREADQVDPQQRLLLELSWEALEDGGLVPSRLAGSAAGVYVGASSLDYVLGNIGDPAVGNAYFMTGTSLSILANRISYLFDLKGPSLTVDTACSSSLVALDLACRALGAGEIELALVGGVNLLLSPYPFIGFSQAQMLSRTGRCFAFDARADGYVRAEGGGVVVLRPLDAALSAGDAIRGVILGTGVNQDGRTVGLSLPSVASQAQLLDTVYRRNRIAPDALSFVEAHGTGTPVGDPIETAALGEALGKRRAAPLPIGSVKSNLGHLEPASGMAGLMKAMLALEHRELPRSLHCDTPNPHIDFAALNLRVATEPMMLPSGNLLAGVNSFGFGGTNAHAILGTVPVVPEAPDETGDVPAPLLLSARSRAALDALTQAWSGETGAAAARGLARHREIHLHRRVVADGAVLAEGAAMPAGRDKLVFVFSGNGAQFPGMARDALTWSAPFREAAARVDNVLAPLLGWSPLEALEAAMPAAIDRTDVAQPLLFLIQVAVVETLRHHGVAPDFCIGHSVGEIAASWSAGALTLEDAATIVVERSRQQERTRGLGRLAALGMGIDEAAKRVARIAGLEIAAINSVGAVTVAGPLALLERLRQRVEQDGAYFHLLDIDYPFHSAAMVPIRDNLIASLGRIAPRGGNGFISTVTGAPVDGAALGADYWWRNIREPVQFAAAIDRAIEGGAGIFVEIGPNPILLSYLRAQLRYHERDGRIIASLTREPASRDPFQRIAADCFVAGSDVAGAPVFAGPARRRGLPAYPWQRANHWFAPTSERVPLAAPAADHSLLGARRMPEQFRWTNLLDTVAHPWLADHAIEQQPVLPAACFVEIAAAAARARFPDAATLEIVNLELVRALPLGAEPREIETRLGNDGVVTIASRARLSDESWASHASGRVPAPDAAPPPAWPDFAPRDAVSAGTLYRIATRLGLDYGKNFRAVSSVETREREARVAFRDGAAPIPDCLLDPARLDGALQGFLALLAEHGGELSGQSLLPVRFGRVRLCAPFGRKIAVARVRIDHVGRRSASGDAMLLDADGAIVAALDEIWFRAVQLRRPLDIADDSFHVALVPAGARGTPPPLDLPEIAPGDDAEIELLLRAYLDASRAPNAALPPADTIWRTVLAESPAHGAELALAAGAIAGAAPPRDLVAQMLFASPTGRRAMAALDGAVARLKAQWPQDAPLRQADFSLDDALAAAARDLIVSRYGLSRLSRETLADASAVLAVEAAPNPLWRAIFPDLNLRDADSWRAALNGAGFNDVQIREIAGGAWPAQLIAARRAATGPEEVAMSDRAALIVAPSGDALARDLVRALGAAGVALLLIDPPAAADGAELLAALAGAASEPEIVVLPATDGDVAARLAGILTVARLAAGTRDKARLTLVTRGADAAANAAMTALLRVVANEMPQLACRAIDVPANGAADYLCREILSPDGESEVVWSGGARRAARLRRGVPVSPPLPESFRLAATRPGAIDSVAPVAQSPATPGAGEIAVRVAAAGLNFRDVMWALDLLPEEALKDGYAGPGLGIECAGTVTAIGPGVDRVAVGDRVAGFAPDALASHAVTRAEAVARLPDGIDFAEAASLPVIYLTAAYALGHLAKLEAGETVLIHGGAGGVGVAAIHYARHRGAQIIATAGSDTKRAFLRAMGVAHVFDSRSLAFADDVMTATGGAGVDVVLNSLGGEAMERSLGLLKPFGRFLELGKRDFYLDTRVGLRPLRQNISYFAVDADQLAARRPALARELLTEIMALVGDGTLVPPPRRVFPFSEAAAAFRLMQNAGHIGKIVLCPDPPLAEDVPLPRGFAVRPDRTYLVTGGLGGFGLATARWLAKRGAKHLALIGRRGAATPGACDALVQFAAAGIDARAYACDVGDENAVRAALDQIRASQSPLGGVVHAAMALDDALLADLDEMRIRAVLAPKLAGAKNLDRLTRGDALDWFLLYGSATTLLGAPGQGSYVAANGALEGVARRRNEEGRPSLAIAWGPIADAGFLAAHGDKRAALSRRLAAAPMKAEEALDQIPALWAGSRDMAALGRVNWGGARRAMKILASPMFEDFAAAMTDAGGGDWRERLEGLPPDEASALIATLLREEIGRVLMLPPDRIERDRPLASLGMDSLMAVELRAALEARLDIRLPLLSLSDATNVASLASLVTRSLAGERGEGRTESVATRHEPDPALVVEAASLDRRTARVEP
jgi:acyl transferase domain-containing protein/acyl carrier protein